MSEVAAEQRGIVAGPPTLSRNLGLVTGASAIATVYPAGGLPLSFVIATGLLAVALGLARRAR